MAILKLFTANVDVAGTYTNTTTSVDTTRVATGWNLSTTNLLEVVHTPSASTTWYHWRFRTTVEFNDKARADAGLCITARQNGVAIAGMNQANGNFFAQALGDSTVNGATWSISLNTTYMMDMEVTVNPTNVIINLYANNVLVSTATAANTVGGKVPGNQLQFTFIDSDVNFQVSEGAIADEDTRSWRIREFVPTSFGVDQAWIGNAAAVSDGDLATGVSTATNAARVSFGISNLQNVQAGDIINRVVAQTYAQRGATGLTRVNHYFRYPDATRQDAADITLTTTGTWYITEFPTNPKTGVAWVGNDLTGIQVGLRAQT